jgi:formamidopyrimidine-DNA glycosylase
MPELPEVETTRRGVAPHVEGRRVEAVIVREARLRWPVPAGLPAVLTGQCVERVERRAKYLLFRTAAGTAILHLGMSGSLRVLRAPQLPDKHDHIDFLFEGGVCLRYSDPRRFGSLHWVAGDPLAHPLLAHLGPEPFHEAFSGDYLYSRSRGRRTPVKSFLMDAEVVVGVGNIYANEALYRAGIRPTRAAKDIGRERYTRLAEAVRAVLTAAIAAGGTTLRDFVSGEGSPGYFAQQLSVYDRAGAPCPGCEQPIQLSRLGQRATYFCPECQR